MAGDVLRRKVVAARQAAAEGGPGADRAWRLAFARATRDMMQLPVDFLGLTLSRVSLAEVLDLPPERALILMLEGPEDGLGLLIMSPDLLSAMIEVLTMGKCGTQSSAPRKPTRTDAAMLSPLADIALTNLEEALAEEGDLVWTSGFRYASFIEEARPLALMLEDVAYRVLNAKLSLFHGAREGEMLLILPADGRGRKPRAKAHSVPDAVARSAFAAALGVRVEGAACQIDAVLARLSLPLDQVMNLSVGALIGLPTANLDRISFEGLDGRRVAEGRLGQNRGMRAIRLTEPEAETLGRVTGSTPVSPTAAAFVADARRDTVAESAPSFAAPDFDFPAFDATGTA